MSELRPQRTRRPMRAMPRPERCVVEASDAAEASNTADALAVVLEANLPTFVAGNTKIVGALRRCDKSWRDALGAHPATKRLFARCAACGKFAWRCSDCQGVAQPGEERPPRAAARRGALPRLPPRRHREELRAHRELALGRPAPHPGDPRAAAGPGAAPVHRLRHARLPGVLRQAGLRPVVDDAGHGRGDRARDHHVVGSAEGDQQAAHARRALRPRELLTACRGRRTRRRTGASRRGRCSPSGTGTRTATAFLRPTTKNGASRRRAA